MEDLVVSGDNIKMELNRVENVNWTHLVPNRVQWRDHLNTLVLHKRQRISSQTE